MISVYRRSNCQYQISDNVFSQRFPFLIETAMRLNFICPCQSFMRWLLSLFDFTTQNIPGIHYSILLHSCDMDFSESFYSVLWGCTVVSKSKVERVGIKLPFIFLSRSCRRSLKDSISSVSIHEYKTAKF